VAAPSSPPRTRLSRNRLHWICPAFCETQDTDLLGRLTKMGKRDAREYAPPSSARPAPPSTPTLVRGYSQKPYGPRKTASAPAQQGVPRLSAVVGAEPSTLCPEAGGDPPACGSKEEMRRVSFATSRKEESLPIRQPDLHGQPVSTVARGEYYLWRRFHLHRRRCHKERCWRALRVGPLLRANASQPRKCCSAESNLVLMAARGFISPDRARGPAGASLRRWRSPGEGDRGVAVSTDVSGRTQRPAAPISNEKTVAGHIQVYSTVNAQVQQLRPRRWSRSLAL